LDCLNNLSDDYAICDQKIERIKAAQRSEQLEMAK